MNILIVLIIFFVFASMFIFSYRANKRIPIPEGCNIPDDLGCSACSAKGSCTVAMRNNINDEEEE